MEMDVNCFLQSILIRDKKKYYTCIPFFNDKNKRCNVNIELAYYVVKRGERALQINIQGFKSELKIFVNLDFERFMMNSSHRAKQTDNCVD